MSKNNITLTPIPTQKLVEPLRIQVRKDIYPAYSISNVVSNGLEKMIEEIATNVVDKTTTTTTPEELEVARF